MFFGCLKREREREREKRKRRKSGAGQVFVLTMFPWKPKQKVQFLACGDSKHGKPFSHALAVLGSLYTNALLESRELFRKTDEKYSCILIAFMKQAPGKHGPQKNFYFQSHGKVGTTAT